MGHEGCFCVIRFQVRYGQRWAPVHPDEPIEGVLTEILLAPGEYFTHMNVTFGLIVDAIQFTTNLHTYPRIGAAADAQFVTTVPLNGLLYFSGASKDYVGVRVSNIAVHKDICEQ